MRVEEPQVLTVCQLNRYVKAVFDAQPLLENITIRGEISNFTNHYRTGHYYFTLKDGQAAVKVVMFQSYARQIPFVPENGMAVLVRGKVSLFERDGTYQLYGYALQPDGVGALYLAFEQMKTRLAAEGLFDQARKRPLPAVPETVGVITSAGAAALQDILNILSRRSPWLRVLLRPTQVQGPAAAPDLAQAVQELDESGRCDVILIARGGGSLEDLWPFNEEALARAIARCQTPVLSGVGHETDYTICDLVADCRAPTPSAAAELVAPRREDLLSYLEDCYGQLCLAMTNGLQRRRTILADIQGLPCFQDVNFYTRENGQRLENLIKLLHIQMKHRLEQEQGQVEKFAALLDSISPLKLLSQGYSITSRGAEVLTDASALRPGEQINTRLARGWVLSQVLETNAEDQVGAK